MAKTYKDILIEIEALTKEASRVRDAEVRGVIARIKEAIASYGITKADLGFGAKKPATPKVPAKRSKLSPKVHAAKKVAPKYRDDAGNTWTGRGLKPRWLTAAIKDGKKIEDFAL